MAVLSMMGGVLGRIEPFPFRRTGLEERVGRWIGVAFGMGV